jgi:drug/metabolite transporter (DMT)-like permease
MNKPENPVTAYFVLTLMAFFLAGNHIIGRAVHGQIPPVGLSFWRWVVGILILLPFALPGTRRHWPTMRQHWRVFALLGFFMIGSTTLILVALTKTFAINVSLLNALQPTLTLLFAWLIFKEALGLWPLLGIACGIFGVVVMVSQGNPAVLSGFDFMAGDFIALLAMCGFSGYTLNLNRLPREIGSIPALFGITIMGTLMLLPVYLWETVAVKPVPVNGVTIGAILALALLVSVLGNLCWNVGNRIIGPSRASIFINLIPVFGIVLATTLLGEQLHTYHVVGGLLVVTGLVLAAGVGSRQRKPKP